MKFSKILFYGLMYMGIAILTYFFFIFQEIISNKILFSLVFSALIIALVLSLNARRSMHEDPSVGFVRYVMSCNDCGWEWMSNLTEKEDKPKMCPHCKQRNISIIGWRKIKLIPKKEKDLREFI